MPRMTSAEYSLYEAKQAAKKPATINVGCSRESELHRQILEECRRRGWIALHGSMADVTRRTIGEPDFVIIADGVRTFYIEAKTKTGKLSPGQQALHAVASKLGHTIHVVRSIEEVIRIFENQ